MISWSLSSRPSGVESRGGFGTRMASSSISFSSLLISGSRILISSLTRRISSKSISLSAA